MKRCMLIEAREAGVSTCRSTGIAGNSFRGIVIISLLAKLDGKNQGHESGGGF